MIWLAVSAVLLLTAGWAVGLLFIGIALWLIAQAAGAPLTVLQYLLLGVMLSAVPAAAFFAGVLLDHCAWPRPQRGVFAGACVGLALAAAGQGGLLVDWIEAAFSVTRSAPGMALLISAAALNAVLLCGSAVALCIVVLQLVVELPFYSLKKALGSPATLPFAALRPLLICAALTLLVHHVADFFIHELSPANFAAAPAAGAAGSGAGESHVPR